MRKTVMIVICMILATAMLLCATSCTVRISAEELSAGYRRTTTKQASVSENFRAAAADFSFDLLENLPMEQGENLLLSPLSALTCLAMITGGAKEETLRQLEEAIGLDEETLTQSLYAYVSGLYSGEKCKVTLANSIWAKNSDAAFHVNKDFLQKNADWYDAQIYRAPFDSTTLKDINRWVKQNTDGMIDKILDKMDPQTVMILINTLVFDAKWQEKYEKSDVSERTFTAYNGTQKQVEMLHSSEGTYLELNGAIGFAKNYEGGKYSFVGLLPEEGMDVYTFARDIDGEDFIEMWDNRGCRSINARIPEFSYNNEFSLKETLQAMGVEDLFDENCADLSGIGSYDDGNLYCSVFKQKTFIEVSRNGTKAAAVTWGEMKDTAAAPEEQINIYLNRPFLYAIVDNATGLPLFVGVVADIAK